mgnify:CR=1 FL=1
MPNSKTGQDGSGLRPSIRYCEIPTPGAPGVGIIPVRAEASMIAAEVMAFPKPAVPPPAGCGAFRDRKSVV